jgi:hypothetical protein
VRIGAHDEVAGRDVPRFHEHQVGDAGIDVIELADAMLAREVPRDLLIGGVLFGFGGRDMVQNDRQPLGVIEPGGSDALHDADRPPSGGVAHDQIGEGVHNFTGRDGRSSRFRRKDFLGNGHCTGPSVHSSSHGEPHGADPSGAVRIDFYWIRLRRRLSRYDVAVYFRRIASLGLSAGEGIALCNHLTLERSWRGLRPL